MYELVNAALQYVHWNLLLVDENAGRDEEATDVGKTKDSLVSEDEEDKETFSSTVLAGLNLFAIFGAVAPAATASAAVVTASADGATLALATSSFLVEISSLLSSAPVLTMMMNLAAPWLMPCFLLR